MTLIESSRLSEPSPSEGRHLKASQLSADRVKLRDLLIEGAISPKTTRLDSNFIEILRRESKARMGL